MGKKLGDGPNFLEKEFLMGIMEVTYNFKAGRRFCSSMFC